MQYEEEKGSKYEKRIMLLHFSLITSWHFRAAVLQTKVSLTHKQLDTVMTVGQLPKFINLKKLINKMCKRNTDQTMEVQKRFGFIVWAMEDAKNQSGGIYKENLVEI